MKKLVLCALLGLFITGCSNNDDLTGDGFCERVIVLSNQYSDSRIESDEFRERAEELNEECPTELNNVCLALRNLLDYIDNNYSEDLIDAANREIKRTCEWELSSEN